MNDDNHDMDYADERRADAGCPHCRGSGRMRHDCIQYECPDCSGSGETTREG